MENREAFSVRGPSLSPIDLISDPIDASAIAESPLLSSIVSHFGEGSKSQNPQPPSARPAVVQVPAPINSNRSSSEDYDERAQLISQRQGSASSYSSTEDDNRSNSEVNKEDEHPPTGLLRTFFNFVKGNIGTGILAMPDAVKNAGLLFGSISVFLIGALCTYCCHQLLHAYDKVSDGRPMGYADVMELSFKKTRQGLPFRKCSTVIRYAVDAFLILNQLGLCCVYFLFTSRMVKEVVDSNVTGGPSIHVYITIMLAVLIPYCLVTTLKVLSVFSFIGNILCFVTLGIILQSVFRNLQPMENVDWIPSDVKTLPLFFGTSVFAFESVALILPIENRMKNRREFHGWNGLLSFSMFLVVSFFFVMGFYGYLAFGIDAKTILSNMPTDSWLYNSARIMYGLAVFITFNLMLYVPVQIMFPNLKKWVNLPWFDKVGEYLFRTTLIILTYALAIGIPCLEYMISLIGALCSASLAIIFPPLAELAVGCHPDRKLTCWMLFKNGFILLFGAFGCVIGTYVSLASIISALNSPKGCGS